MSGERKRIVRRTDPGGSHEAAEVVSLEPRERVFQAAEHWLTYLTPYHNPNRGTEEMLTTYMVKDRKMFADRGLRAPEKARRELRNLRKAGRLLVSNDKRLKLANPTSGITVQVYLLPFAGADVVALPVPPRKRLIQRAALSE